MDDSWILNSLESTAMVGSWVVDIEKQTCIWSKGTYAIHEENPEKPIALQDGINYYIEPHRPIIQKCVEDGIAQNKPWDVELQIKTTSGKIKWVRAIGEPVKENGQLKMLRGVFHDIDSKKKLSSALSLTHQKLQLALTSSKIGIWEWKIKTDTLLWDDRMFQLYGVDEKNFSSAYEAWVGGLHPDDKERGQKEIEMALAGEKSFDTQFRVVWPSGEIHHIKAYGVVLRDQSGQPEGMLGTNWDITKSVEDQSKLEHSNHEMQIVFDAIPGLVMHKRTSDDVMVRVNKYAAETMNTTVEKMNGRPSKDFYDPALCEKYHQDDLEVVNSNQPKFGIIEEVHNADGRRFWTRTDKVPYVDAEGKTTGVVTCAFDISEQVKIQNDLEQLNEELIEFSYRTSHDLKAPLTTSKTMSKFIVKDIESGDLNEAKNNAKKIFEQMERLEVLIEDIISLARADFADDSMESIDMSKMISEIKEKLRWMDGEGRVEFRDRTSSLSPFFGDKSRISQILENLISNSIKYQDASKQSPYVMIEGKESGGDIHLIVSDNGLGVPDTDPDNLFKMFKRFHPKVAKGSGLGLSIVRKNIDRLSGSIQVDSSNQGTSFTVIIPKGERDE